MQSAFIHLRLHSEYSIVDGIVRVDEAVAAAKADGMPALGLTDLGNVFGLVKFYTEARGKGIKVAVLDTGIDWTHPDLAANVKGAVSFVPGQTAMDGHGHGTHCAGTIGAPINGIGVVGVDPEAWLYAV